MLEETDLASLHLYRWENRQSSTAVLEDVAACTPTSGFKSQCLCRRVSAGQQFCETPAGNLRGEKRSFTLFRHRAACIPFSVLPGHPRRLTTVGLPRKDEIRLARRRVRHREDPPRRGLLLSPPIGLRARSHRAPPQSIARR